MILQPVEEPERFKEVIVMCKNSLNRAGRFVRLFAAVMLTSALHGSTLLSENIVSGKNVPDAFTLAAGGSAAVICCDSADWKGVIRAAGDLQADIERVTGTRPDMNDSATGKGVLIGTLGKSALIDGLVSAGKLNTSAIEGKWESFIIATVDGSLVVAGSDKRGTIYGIYEISEQIGVSPWYWWADVPAKKHNSLYVRAGEYCSGEPAVKYRGIFINDEEPCFGPWAREKFGGINSKMYSHMFELILRLRGNYLWPAMWGKAFNEDDPENPRLADEYGIVMGTSHHEPMVRAQTEWTKRSKNIGNGEWNYATNKEGLQGFWRDGIARNKDYENIVTIGMRGDGDEPMIKGGDMAANVGLLEQIVADQREMIAEAVNPDVRKVPQMWALYKEVSGYYEHGMRVPDDVTLLWCDDNWGNIRRLPTPEERKRSGGAGIYYHFDYVGAPRCYKWANTNPLPKVWEQMNIAYEYDARRIWVVNVGDLKPMELPIDFFLQMAWNPRAMPKERISDYMTNWAEQQFGAEFAREIADIAAKYAKYNGWRKPELLTPETFSLVNYSEAERVLEAWEKIERRAEAINAKLPEEYKGAYYQLILHPVKSAATVAKMYIAAGRGRLYAKQGRASANEQAQLVRELFALDKALTTRYHELNGGKWNHMMAQTHLGYTSWRDPVRDVMPEVVEVQLGQGAVMGVAVEGSQQAWPATEALRLPAVDSVGAQRRWIDIFRQGAERFEFTASANRTWIRISELSGTVDGDKRIFVEVDAEKAPEGESSAIITINGPEGQSARIDMSVVGSDKYAGLQAFGSLTGPAAFAAESAAKNIPAGVMRWEKIPDYGRGASAMAVFPVTARSIEPPEEAPCLEYPVLIAEAGRVQVELMTGTGLKIQPDRGVRIAVSFDDQPPQVLDAFKGQFSGGDGANAPAFRDWDNWVRDNIRTLRSVHEIEEAGVHQLKVRMVDPAVVLEKIVVHSGELPKSYFGPPAGEMR